jgi:histone H3/H4
MADVSPATAATAHSAAAQMCQLVSSDQGVAMTSDAASVVATMAVEFARVVGIDAVAFASHRGRKVIGVEDILLLCRRDRNSLDLLSRFDSEQLQPMRDAKRAAAARKSSAGGSLHQH